MTFSYLIQVGSFIRLTLYREALLVPTKSRQTEAPVAKNGPQQLVVNGSQIIIYGGWNGFQVLSDVIFIDLKKGVGKFAESL